MVDSGSFKTPDSLKSSKRIEGLRRDALSSNSPKEADASAQGLDSARSLDAGEDIGKFNICFAGHPPDNLFDVPHVLRELSRLRNRDLALAAERSSAGSDPSPRGSETISFEDRDGIKWRYHLLQDGNAAIEKCECGSVEELRIPNEIDGAKVVSICEEACASLDGMRDAIIADSVVQISAGAFRNCGRLRFIRFPKMLDRFDAGWLKGCPVLEEIHLPGNLEKITPAIFDFPALKSLHIGAGTSQIMPGAFAKSALEKIDIDPENWFLDTDGHAIYGLDGLLMLTLAIPCKRYSVREDCKAIARKAMNGFPLLEKVDLVDSLELIGDYAFAKTGISEFIAPNSLKIIGERAFYACENLSKVILDHGLLSIGNHAFTDTRISSLTLPSTITDLGDPVADGTGLSFSGDDATFSIADADDALMFIDEGGAIYIKRADGLHLSRMLDKDAREYALNESTVAIDKDAFSKHPHIENVVLNDGLKEIGKGAFRGCRNLKCANLPQTLEHIDDDAFLDTSVTEMHLGRRISRIGSMSLITYGAHHASTEPSLRHISVDPANPKYYMHDGLLIEHMDNDTDRVLLCTGEVADVSIPKQVSAIASYAFNGVRRLRSLYLGDSIIAIDVRGLAFDSLPDLIHVDVAQPVDGHSFFDFEFPSTSRSAQQLALVFGAPSFVDVASIFDGYDNAIVSRTGFGGGGADGKMGAYEQGRRIIERLLDPVYLTQKNRGMMESVLRSHLDEICTDTAKHDDKTLMEGLLDLGYIDSENIDRMIDVIGRIQDASITNYLLDQKRRRFGSSVLDFEL